MTARRQFLLYVATALAAVGVFAGDVAQAGKPGGGGSTLPKVRYQIQLWSPPGGGHGVINDMNTQGQVIGWYLTSSGEQHAFVCDPSLTQAINLNTIATPEPGWVIASAVGINDFGIIVGYLKQVATNGTVRAGYILDIFAASPVLQPIPDYEWSNTFPRAINEDGDILGLYQNSNGFYGVYIYNPTVDPVPEVLGIELQQAEYCGINNSTFTRGAQVVLQIRDGSSAGIAKRWTRAGGFETPLPGSNTSARDINDSGMICGGTTAKLGKGLLQTYPFRYTNSLEILASPGLLAASRINSAGDLLVGNLMYREGTGFLKLDDLIDRTDPDAALWFSPSSGSTWPSEMNDRIAGRIRAVVKVISCCRKGRSQPVANGNKVTLTERHRGTPGKTAQNPFEPQRGSTSQLRFYGQATDVVEPRWGSGRSRFLYLGCAASRRPQALL